MVEGTATGFAGKSLLEIDEPTRERILFCMGEAERLLKLQDPSIRVVKFADVFSVWLVEYPDITVEGGILNSQI